MANYFLDITSLNDGDGLSAAPAPGNTQPGSWNTLFGKLLEAGDIVWIRRVVKLTENLLFWNLDTSGVKYIGWPKSGDIHFTSRPGSGISQNWDTDVSNYFEIVINSSSQSMVIGGSNVEVHRLKVNHNFVGSTLTSAIRVTSTGSNIKIYNCSAHNKNTASSNDNRAWSIWSKAYLFNCIGRCDTPRTTANCFYLNAAGLSLQKCIAEGIGSSSAIGYYFNNHARLIECDTVMSGNSARGVFGNAGNVQIEGGHFNNTHTAIDLKTNGNFSFDIRDVRITSPHVSLLYDNGGHAHIRQYTQTSPSTYGIRIVSGLLVLDNATFLNNTVGDIHIGINSRLVGRNISFGSSVAPIVGISNYWANNEAYVVDFNGAVGNWKSWQPDGVVELTSQISRVEGEENFSIRMRYTGTPAYVLPVPLHLGINGHETIWVPVSPGNRTITIFGTYVGYDDSLTSDDVWLEFDYLNQPSGASRLKATTKTVSSLTPDTSNWEGITLATKFKLTATVSVGQQCFIPVRVYLGKHSDSGIVYIDPRPIIS